MSNADRNVHRCFTTRQKGVAIIELTIVLPLVLFIMIAVAELGRAFMHYNGLTKAVRDGARYVAANAIQGSTGTVDLAAKPQVVTAAQNLVVHGNILGNGTPLLPVVAPTVTVTDEGAGNISVLASYPYQPMLGLILPDVMGTGGIPTTFTMQAKITMRAL